MIIEITVINKIKVRKTNEPVPSSKKDDASGKEDHYQRVLQNMHLSGFKHDQREQVKNEETIIYQRDVEHSGTNEIF